VQSDGLRADLLPDPNDDPDPSTAFLVDLAEPAEWLPNAPPGERRPAVRNVVGIKFQTAGKIYLYDGGDESFRHGETVVVESERGPRLGVVAVDSVRRAQSRASLKRILRRPSAVDREGEEDNQSRAAAVLAVARAQVQELGLPIKVFRAEYNLVANRLTLYYSAESKVDQRLLARTLSQEIPGRIELRQTGVRDEAKLIGGIGSCGETLCCSTWLPAFVPVSIRNAKDQGLVLNPAKVSGQCGRLKCCLVYEQEQYAELRKGMPKLGKRVTTVDGSEGRVVEVDVLHQRVRVSLPTGEFRVYASGEVKLMFPSAGSEHAPHPTEGG
jgi:cell fate regulator YaaT (PSP1 superfamily)